jgi:hypothetical protein
VNESREAKQNGVKNETKLQSTFFGEEQISCRINKRAFYKWISSHHQQCQQFYAWNPRDIQLYAQKFNRGLILCPQNFVSSVIASMRGPKSLLCALYASWTCSRCSALGIQTLEPTRNHYQRFTPAYKQSSLYLA